MASVHLSISKHSVIFPLHRRRGQFFFLFSRLHHRSPLLSSFLLQPLSPVSFIYHPTSPFYIFCPPWLSSFCLSFFSSPAFSRFFLFPLHPSPRHPFLPPLLLAISCALSGTAHSATKQSCLQHHTLANQARPEFSSPSDPLNGTMIPVPHWRGEVSHTRRWRKRRIWSGWGE